MGRAKTTNPNPELELPTEAFDRIPRAQVTFTDESVYVTRFDERGRPTVTYPAVLADVASAFNVLGARSGFLPADTLFWERQANRERIGIYLPPQGRTLTFDLGKKKTTVLRVPLPGMVFVGHGTHYWIHAVKERPDGERAEMFVAPLPNVNDNGLICAGSVKFPVCASETIHAAAQLFFESGFNHDLSNDKFLAQGEDDEHEEAMNEWYGGRYVRTREKEQTLFHFLQDLKGDAAFPLDRLAPAGTTLKQLMQGANRQ